jgi:hypothetical protein
MRELDEKNKQIHDCIKPYLIERDTIRSNLTVGCSQLFSGNNNKIYTIFVYGCNLRRSETCVNSL